MCSECVIFRSRWAFVMVFLAAVVTGPLANASSRLARIDNPNYICALQYWFPTAIDPYATADGNTDGLGDATNNPTFFNPGTLITNSAIGPINPQIAVSGPYTNPGTTNWNVTSPAYCTPTLPLSTLWSAGDLNQSMNLAAYGSPPIIAISAQMYEWVTPPSSNASDAPNLPPDAVVIVWTLPPAPSAGLPNGGLELEFGGWCTNNVAGAAPGAAASFSWDGNLYTVGTATSPCSGVLYPSSSVGCNGPDLLLNPYGVLVGSVDCTGKVTQGIVQGWQPSFVTIAALSVAPASVDSANVTVTLQASVAALPGSTPPTGNLTFSIGGSTVGPVALNGAGVATATFDTTSLLANSYSVTASYAGDTNHLASSATAQTLVVTAQPSMAFTESSNSTTVAPGQPATDTITLAPANGFNDTIALSCSGLPALTTCGFSPASAAVANQPVKSTLTISTTASMTTQNSIRLPPFLPGGGVVLAGLGFPLMRRRNKSPGHRRATLFLIAALGSMVLGACGGGSAGSGGTNTGNTPGTPAGVYSVTITAKGSTTTQTLIYTLTVS